jgi:hypothetical protein
MAIITPKRTLSTELRPSPRAPLAVHSGHPAVVERVLKQIAIAEILDTSLCCIESYPGNRGSTTTTNARTLASAQHKYPNNRIRSLLQTGYVEMARAVKIKVRAAIIPEMWTKTLGGKWVMSQFISAVKMAKLLGRQPREIDGSS